MSNGVPVQVALRVRPLVESESKKGCVVCLDRIPNEPQVVVRGTDKAFTFNYVFGSTEDNERLYETAVKDLVMHIFKGYNVTVLAYGQTGSGKTFCMGTSHTEDENRGVIPRAVTDIFKKIDELTDRDIEVTVSFTELYQEQLFDLLAQEKTAVDIREDESAIVIPGLTKVPVYCTEDATKCLSRGCLRRAIDSTAMNAESSRSHAIFTVTVTQRFKDEKGNHCMAAKLTLVDLAGSERQKKTNAAGERLRESVNINSGLFALGNVISALGDKSQRRFIQYRGSKLTRLLRDSLGGNSVTLMIACVSPADYNLDETINTLRYADRARRIKNKPVVKRDLRAVRIASLTQEIQELQLQLINVNRTKACLEEHKLLQEYNANLDHQNTKLSVALSNVLEGNARLTERALKAKNTDDRMRMKVSELNSMYGKAMEGLNRAVDPDAFPASLWELLKGMHVDIQNFQAELRCSAQEILDHQLFCDVDVAQNSDHVERNYVSVDKNSEHVERNEVDVAKNCDHVERNDVDVAKSSEHVERNGALPKPHAEIEIDRKADEYALHLVELIKKLKNHNKSLAESEELVVHFEEDSKYLLNFETELESKIKAFEMQLQGLHKEKQDLQHSLMAIVFTESDSKEREQYTRRLAEIEQTIPALNKKITRQYELIKVKKERDQDIILQKIEIQSMKEERVRLIKQVKFELWNWKLELEREFIKLRDQNRKQQSEMAHQRLDSKEKNELKRELQRSVATEKRLTAALALQGSALGQQTNADSTVEFQAQELEAVLRLMDAETTLEQQMEDRDQLTEQQTEYRHELTEQQTEYRDELTEQQTRNKRRLPSGSRAIEGTVETEKEVKQLLEDIATRNKQVLQRKIVDRFG